MRASMIFKNLFAKVFTIICFYSFVSLAEPPPVQIFTQQPQQGSLIIGRMLVDGNIYYADKLLPLTEAGEFVFGVGRDAPSKIQLQIHSQNNSINFPVVIIEREWKIERVDGLAEEKVNPKSKQTLARIKQEGALVSAARRVESEQNAFLMKFIQPAKGRISGVYGSQRILNGESKRPHFGLDIANSVGTKISAPADGVVTLAEQDLFYSGGTIIIDHGFGVSSTYLHLSDIGVDVGQVLTQGQLIGKMGDTGRATGSHLDWRLNWGSTRLDPQLLLSN